MTSNLSFEIALIYWEDGNEWWKKLHKNYRLGYICISVNLSVSVSFDGTTLKVKMDFMIVKYGLKLKLLHYIVTLVITVKSN